MEKEKDIKDGVQEVACQLFEQYGYVKPSDLVAAAKPKTSPAHSGFEWDDKKAGHEYRLAQARRWIRVVTVTVEETEQRFVHIPKFIEAAEEDDSVNNEGYYKPIFTLQQTELERAMDETKRRLHVAQEAFDELKDAVGRSPETPKKTWRQIGIVDSGFRRINRALQEITA